MSENKEELKEEQINQEEVEQNVETQEVHEETNEPKELTLEEKIAELEAKLKESEDKYFRVHADFENIKKRLEKEKYQAIDYASEKFAKDLLAPIDTLEMALAAEEAAKEVPAEELLAKLKEGVELTIKNFYTAFEKHDISIVETEGEFDPNFHNAVMQVDSTEHEDGQIVQALQKGYLFKDRLLRPAMVSICKK
ncbi:nucleotide exchange factor GrpE [Halarcobacter bivalviorum]|uniref:Protein GrpE n=1 Tax=Halarcobacter bivalviorum TaxID=663364 RepID=A0AAX2A7M9_9BACT|nr:nucleotide exchange factor GrpE [Halarcobacter bivalviorum]AXH13425.1 DnaK system nucleotide exchange factor GrpE [Halarcobacter bivalviorum]RXK09975.1 nucleotide exchange factor GrpE [Halarcobacter bivalviorum]